MHPWQRTALCGNEVNPGGAARQSQTGDTEEMKIKAGHQGRMRPEQRKRVIRGCFGGSELRALMNPTLEAGLAVVLTRCAARDMEEVEATQCDRRCRIDE